ncbi:MAG: looped-hinge helix DNA binding domain, AbrB family [halophilic archaeon J07HB67]|nr:MAG: looped-hinge helix DNA binding domain, AbrB family [halophilic archaeon J07HB67]
MSSNDSERVVSVSARGQTTVPKEFRERLGVDAPGRIKLIETDDGEVMVRPITSVTDRRGVLAGETDESGRTGMEVLAESRSRDAADNRSRGKETDGEKTTGDEQTGGSVE